MSISAAELNAQFGTDVFSDASGSLVLDLDALTGDSLDLTTPMAEPLMKLLKLTSETAAALAKDQDSYPPLTRSIQTINGEPFARYSATVSGKAPLTYDSITALT